MALEQIWLTLLSVTAAGLIIAVVFLWKREGGRVELPAPDWPNKVEALENRLTQHVDSVLSLAKAQIELLSQLISTRGLGQSLEDRGSRETSSLGSGEEVALEQPLAEARTVPLFTPQFEPQPEEVFLKLDVLLNSKAFLLAVWPRLVGDFFSCRQEVLAFLQAGDIGALEIEPYPVLRDANPNHWEFMRVAPRGRGNDARGFLVPCHFARYDPPFHGHLFELRGRVDDLEMFIRRLFQCAVVNVDGLREGSIGPDRVEVRGVISVSEGDVQ